MILPTPPPDWTLTHLIFLDPEWQVNLRNDEYVVTATGTTIEDAFAAAQHKVETRTYAGRLFKIRHLIPEAAKAAGGLLEMLGLGPKPIKRRKI